MSAFSLRLKQQIVLALSVLATFNSCNKDYDDPDNTWRVNGRIFTATNVSHSYDSSSGYKITATNKDNNIPSIVFWFAKFPNAGSYKVGSNVLDTNNVLIAASYYDAYFYEYVCDNKDSTRAEVTINGGKISITLPPCNAYSTTKLSDVKISAKAISE